MKTKKNSLVTWQGLCVAEARRVMEMELVLEARIAELLAMPSKSLNSFFLISLIWTKSQGCLAMRKTKIHLHMRVQRHK